MGDQQWTPVPALQKAQPTSHRKSSPVQGAYMQGAAYFIIACCPYE